jgi:hypothetical protein
VEPTVDDLLKGMRAEGQLHSQSGFQLSPEKALQKVAELGLPFALKVIQAAVEVGARRVDITLQRDQLRFTFPGREEWDMSHIERAFYLRENPRNLAYDHLVRALWALHTDFAFELSDRQKLCWKKGEMKLQSESLSDDDTTLIVHTGGTTLSFLSYFKSARVIAAVSKVVSDRAFAAPIPIRLDGRRINSLHNSPSHGEHVRGQTMLAVFLQDCPRPNLKLPWREETYSDISRQIGVENTKNIGCCALLTVRSKYWMRGQSVHWRGSAPGSVWHWVQSGVIIQTDRLPARKGGLSWAVLLSADGLGTDLTSFGLNLTPGLKERQDAVMASFLRNLRSYRPRYYYFISTTDHTGTAWEQKVTAEVRSQIKEWKKEYDS